MRTINFAILALVPLVGANTNDYVEDWENTIPNCQPKQCGKEGECGRFEVCSEIFRGRDTCNRIWTHKFCNRECPQAPGGVRMVLNPRRYCECIAADELNDMFCEATLDPRECVCTAIYDPVTCEDGKEYSNSCFAGCNGQTQCAAKVDEPVEEEEPSETEDVVDDKPDDEEAVDDESEDDREKPCACPKIYRPVTCESGVTFPNLCLAECSGQTDCSRKNEKRVFDRSDFTTIIFDFQNELNRPTGLGVNDRKGAYTGLANEYSNSFNRPTGLGRDEEQSPDSDDEETEATE